MAVDVSKITEGRKVQRDALDVAHRQALALEQIADTLEAIRGEMVLSQHALSEIPRAISHAAQKLR
jgi:hypothetical protein